jgi:NADPH:quinone reductase-like Zn-dependent oxidoreductase
MLPEAPFGGMGERVAVRADRLVDVPDDVDDVTAAAIANAGMSSWAALLERAMLQRGETVLINGATGTSGRLAVRIAKHLGAGRVIATGRNPAILQSLPDEGADATIALTASRDELDEAFAREFARGVDVVLDYVWGSSAEAIVAAAAAASDATRPVRFVNIGTMSATTIALPGAALRSSGLVLLGSGLGSVPDERLLASIAGVFGAVAPAGLSIETTTAPLAEVESRWHAEGSDRLVFLFGSEA